MSEQHTQGRLTFRENGEANSFALMDEGGQWLLALLHNGHQMPRTQAANMRRLVACWNACNGLSTELLEGALVTMLSKMGPSKPDSDGRMSAPMHYPIHCAEIRELATQRDQLLAVCSNFEVTGPDDDGLLWLVLHGNGTTGKAMFNLHRASGIAGQVVLLLEQDRHAATADWQATYSLDGAQALRWDQMKDLNAIDWKDATGAKP